MLGRYFAKVCAILQFLTVFVRLYFAFFLIHSFAATTFFTLSFVVIVVIATILLAWLVGRLGSQLEPMTTSNVAIVVNS